MSTAYLNRSKEPLSMEQLRSVYYGSTKQVVAERFKKEAKMEKAREKQGIVKNPYRWQLEHVEGFTEHVRLTAVLLEKPVEILVYKHAAEKGLRPHLDIHIPSQQDIHLTPEMLLELNEVVAEAKKVLAGEVSDYFEVPVVK